MSMTESDALEKLKLEGGLEIGGKPKRLAEFLEALFIAEKALSEIQQYRAIGTVSEFRELKEKATAKRPFGEYFGWTCPNCGEYHHEKKSHCTECNQTILWT